MDRVADAVREVSAEVIEPRFGALAAGEVRTKAPGEVVTAADEEAERLLARRLVALVDAPVVGEEAVSARAGLLGALGGEQAWLVDPLDGTANFVTGSPDWAVMVALLRRGETVASWIWRPGDAAMYRGELHAGAQRNGVPLRLAPDRPPARRSPVDPGRLRGAVLTRFLDPDQRVHVQQRSARFAAVTAGRMCAGVDYPMVAEGAQDFVAFHRTLPWDHAPGALLVQEAGGVAGRPDGRRYRPTDGGTGLLAAAGPDVWEAVRAGLLAPAGA